MRERERRFGREENSLKKKICNNIARGSFVFLGDATCRFRFVLRTALQGPQHHSFRRIYRSGEASFLRSYVSPAGGLLPHLPYCPEKSENFRKTSSNREFHPVALPPADHYVAHGRQVIFPSLRRRRRRIGCTTSQPSSRFDRSFINRRCCCEPTAEEEEENDRQVQRMSQCWAQTEPILFTFFRKYS